MKGKPLWDPFSIIARCICVQRFSSLSNNHTPKLLHNTKRRNFMLNSLPNPCSRSFFVQKRRRKPLQNAVSTLQRLLSSLSRGELRAFLELRTVQPISAWRAVQRGDPAQPREEPPIPRGSDSLLFAGLSTYHFKRSKKEFFWSLFTFEAVVLFGNKSKSQLTMHCSSGPLFWRTERHWQKFSGLVECFEAAKFLLRAQYK